MMGDIENECVMCVLPQCAEKHRHRLLLHVGVDVGALLPSLPLLGLHELPELLELARAHLCLVDGHAQLPLEPALRRHRA